MAAVFIMDSFTKCLTGIAFVRKYSEPANWRMV